MATYDVKRPDGKVYRVKAPDGASREEIVAKVKEQASPPEKPQEGNMAGGLRTLANAALFGGGSEVAGGINAIYGGGRQLLEGNFDKILPTMSGMYEAGEAKARAKEDAFAERNPKTALGLTLAGGLATGAPLAVATAPGAGASLVARSAIGAGTGIAEGAVAGGLYSKPGERAQGGVIGGALGFGVGALTPALAQVLSAPVKMAYRSIAAKHGYGSKKAQDYLARALARDGLTPEDAAAKMRELGPNAGLVDVGPNTSALGEAAAQRPGQGLTAAVDFVTDRQGQQLVNIQRSLTEAVGPKGRMLMTRFEDSPQFKEILSRSYPVPKGLVDLFKVPDIAKAYRKARTNAIRRGGDPAQYPDFDQVIADIQSGKISGVNMDLMHKIKIGLDGVIEPMREAQKRGATLSVAKDDLNALNDLRARFRNIARGMDDDYGKALDKLSAEFKVDDAYRQGLDAFKPQHDPKAAMRGMDERQVNAYRQGVADMAIDKVSGTAEIGGDATSALLRQKSRLTDVFGDRGERLVKNLSNLRSMKQTDNRLLSNSRTGFRAALKEDMDAGVLPGEMMDLVGAAATGNVPGLLNRAVQSGGKYMSGVPQGRALDELAAPLFGNEELFRRYARGIAASQRGATMQNRVGQGLLTGGAYSGGYLQGQ